MYRYRVYSKGQETHADAHNSVLKDSHSHLSIISYTMYRYAVYCKFHGTHGVLGLSLTLVTQTDKHRY